MAIRRACILAVTMAQKASAHPRVTVGRVTLVNGVLAAAEVVPGMTAKSVVRLTLRSALNSAGPGPNLGGIRYQPVPGAGSFQINAINSANPAATIATDQSILDYAVFTDPIQT